MKHSIEIDILHILWLVSTDFAIKLAIIKQMLEKKEFYILLNGYLQNNNLRIA